MSKLLNEERARDVFDLPRNAIGDATVTTWWPLATISMRFGNDRSAVAADSGVTVAINQAEARATQRPARPAQPSNRRSLSPIVTGRESMSHWDDTLAKWKSDGGDVIAEEYAAAFENLTA